MSSSSASVNRLLDALRPLVSGGWQALTDFIYHHYWGTLIAYGVIWGWLYFFGAPRLAPLRKKLSPQKVVPVDGSGPPPPSPGLGCLFIILGPPALFLIFPILYVTFTYPMPVWIQCAFSLAVGVAALILAVYHKSTRTAPMTDLSPTKDESQARETGGRLLLLIMLPLAIALIGWMALSGFRAIDRGHSLVMMLVCPTFWLVLWLFLPRTPRDEAGKKQFEHELKMASIPWNDRRRLRLSVNDLPESYAAIIFKFSACVVFFGIVVDTILIFGVATCCFIKQLWDGSDQLINGYIDEYPATASVGLAIACLLTAHYYRRQQKPEKPVTDQKPAAPHDQKSG